MRIATRNHELQFLILPWVVLVQIKDSYLSTRENVGLRCSYVIGSFAMEGPQALP